MSEQGEAEDERCTTCHSIYCSRVEDCPYCGYCEVCNVCHHDPCSWDHAGW